MKMVSCTMTLNSHGLEWWMIWLVTICHLVRSVRGDDATSNGTSVPELEFEPALQCGNQSAYSIQNFVALLGGRPGSSTTGSVEGTLAVPQDMPVGPSCGNVVPSGRGFWFPIQPETQGQIEMIFCTNSTAVTMVPIVYTAPRVSANETTYCDDLYCVAEGITSPLQTTEPILSEGTTCPDANSYNGVRFTATEDQFYFVYVDVTSETTELNSLQATTMVADLAVTNDYCSSSTELTFDSQTITTDDFVNVHMDFVPSSCGGGNRSTSSAVSWTDEWKGVWYTLPNEDTFLNKDNFTQWDLDFCSSTTNANANFYVAIYEGISCENLNCFMEGISQTCSFTIALPNNDTNQVYHLFVYTDKDPAIGGSVTLKVAPHGMNGASSRSVDIRPWWGEMMNWISVLVSISLL